jgi:ferric-dicitrate binding protein FerR (iron transport regulator)
MKKENNHLRHPKEVLIKYLTGSANEAEREYARNWINENKKNQLYFDELHAYYLTSKITQKPSGFNKDVGWNRVQAKFYKANFLDEVKKRKLIINRAIFYSIFNAAAIVLIAFLISNNFFHRLKLIRTEIYDSQNEIIVPLGAKSTITLPDGTKVWLNAGSRLSYPANFEKKSREVYLEGEAYFDVRHYSRKNLFVVKTSDITIKVYGTQFNVKSYPDENIIQTTLVKGSVAIETNSGSQSGKAIFLKPNQTATFVKFTTTSHEQNSKIIQDFPDSSKKVNEKILIAPLKNPEPIISWKDEKWIIEGEKLEQLAIKLERRYNVKISFENESLKQYKFSGTLKDETFEQVLKIIMLSAPIVYDIEGNRVKFIEDPYYKRKYDKMLSNP